MGIFRTNDPTQFDDIDGIVVDESAPPSAITGAAANVAIMVGQFQRGPKELSLVIGSIGEFNEIYGKSSFSGNKQLRNKKFGALRIIRAFAADAVKATLTVDTKLKFDAKHFGAYGNNIKITVGNVAGDASAVAATFSGAVAGVTGTVTLTANVAGTAGNSILLTGDGSTTLTALVSAWNAANVGNQVTLGTANGANTPNNAVAMQLAGGAASVNAGFKVTIEDTNVDAVLPIEIYDGLTAAALTTATFAGSNLVAVTILSQASDPANQTATSLAAGSDGTITNTDYETAIVLAEEEKAGNVLFLDSYNAVRNGYLKTHVAAQQDKMVIVCGQPGDNKAAAIADVVNYRDADGRIMYAWPYVETSIDNVLELTPPAAWIASIFSQTSPHIALSFTGNTGFLAGIVDLEFKESRNGYISLNSAGIMSLEYDKDVGYLVKNAVTTHLLNTEKREVLRRRMTDFLTDSIAFYLKNYQNDVNSSEKRDEVKATILSFDTLLVASKVLPGQKDVKGGAPLLVDTESLNTDAVIALGQFKIIYKRRIFSSMRYIVLQAEIGTSVVVTEI